VAGRALVWSNPDIIALVTREFIAVAENSSYLQRQADAKGEFFRLIAEQGHYAGRTVPSATRQGTYAADAEGRLLASVNTRDPEKMLAMLHEALGRWREQAGDRRQATGEAGLPAFPGPIADRLENLPHLPSYDPDSRYRREYPEDGLVLTVYARDLPRADDGQTDDWRKGAVNHDHAWFTRAEMRSLLPDDPQVGHRYPVPPALVRRLARFHLIDNVRGETPMWRPEEVQHAAMTLEVTGVTPGQIDLRLEGAVRNVGRGSWAIRPFRERLTDAERGFDCRLLGFLGYDTLRGRFARFDVIALGTRWGGSEHNVRWDDLAPAPMAVGFELAGTTPADRTPPQGSYSEYWG
jgi:hypothetical protein